MTKINVVIPMAGMGARFYQAGYNVPKPFIDIKGKMMIERVLDNLKYPNANYILISRREHCDLFQEKMRKLELNYNVKILHISNVTDGAACTVLAAHQHINNNIPLLIANSDQIVDMNISHYIDDCFKRELDGSILTFKDADSKWSFVRMDSQGFVKEVKEKVPISDHATVGIYLFSKGKDFIDGVMDMIADADKTNGEYYVCPVYNHILKKNKKIGIYEIKANQMHCTGTPSDLEIYLKELSTVSEEAKVEAMLSFIE